ncbi:metalloprotease family protein [Clostridium perfringens]|uniref:metalloprotease family protein n=1 Tax=Clostridium perfringens TaxID=1502 RepID=UPI0024BD4B28|nr:metalloprotease family protein [Clostridium perfringens]
MNLKLNREIHKKNVSFKLILVAILYNVSIVIISFKYSKIRLNYITPLIFILPLIVLGTLIIHEYIHILLFKYFSNGNAEIEVIRDKEIKSIIMYQKNKEVLYTPIQTIVILISPMILLTLLTIPLLYINIKCVYVILMINMILNIMGSTTDMILSLILLLKYNKKGILINYAYSKEFGVILNINEKIPII